MSPSASFQAWHVSSICLSGGGAASTWNWLVRVRSLSQSTCPCGLTRFEGGWGNNKLAYELIRYLKWCYDIQVYDLKRTNRFVDGLEILEEMLWDESRRANLSFVFPAIFRFPVFFFFFWCPTLFLCFPLTFLHKYLNIYNKHLKHFFKTNIYNIYNIYNIITFYIPLNTL